MQQSKNN